MGVSKNRGTRKSSILIGFSIINHPFWGTPFFWKHPNRIVYLLYLLLLPCCFVGNHAIGVILLMEYLRQAIFTAGAFRIGAHESGIWKIHVLIDVHQRWMEWKMVISFFPPKKRSSSHIDDFEHCPLGDLWAI